ncbi:hypothetical protein BG006_006238 [Podila minutissima]|uniref:Uncharacterized protein n=1 Tax=Podila minutissima TaxID=64525 RepID=A0A9P5VLK3_9FUNG|nr:hypothetical protein BG006_006238 [Podila minutissima]
MTPPDDPWHVLDQLDFSSPSISNPSLLATELKDGSSTLLMVHLHARILYEVNHEALKRTWIFPKDILAFRWADTSSSQSYPTLIVATVDGMIWSIMGQGPPPPLQSQTQAPEPVKQEVKVKQEPELIVLDEEEDEIELWNDEVGLLLQDVDFDAVPEKKRQRTQSPPAMDTDPRPSIEVVIIDASKDQLGSEENVTNMVFAFGGLLIFRENSDPILWNSLGWKPNVPIRKRILHLDPLTHITTLLALTSMPGKARKRSNALYVGTKTGHIFSVIISDPDDPKAEENLLDPKLEEKLVDSTAVQRILDIQEPVVSIFLSDDLILVAVGSTGRVFELDLSESKRNIRKPCVFQIGMPIRHAINAEASYFLSTEGQIYRKSGAEELHRSETPPMCALTSTLNKIYGLNTSGQVLEFSQDFHRYFHPVSTLSIREGISTSLSELEQVSEEIKILERQCQVENQRIATYNRIVHELQQSIMNQSQQEKTQGHSTPPVDITTTTFIQPVLMGSREPRRHTIRLTITSAIDIDWSAGWSVGICLAPAPTSCPHENHQKKPGLCQEDFASLETLSRHAPYTVDLEVDLRLMRLPLRMSVALYYVEPTTDTKDSTYQYNPPLSARFFVFDMELDALCFAEPVADLEKRRQPPVMSMATAGTELWDGFGDCVLCQGEIQNRMATPLAPLVVRLDEDITVDQCLSALVVDGLPRDKAIRILQNAYKAVMTIDEDCLPHSGPKSIGSSKVVPSPVLGIVWVVLEQIGEASGEMEVAISVQGQDPRRIMTVYQALEKRTKLLFE